MIDKLIARREKRKRNEEELKELLEDTTFEKGDLPALIIAALTTVLPLAVIIFAALFLLTKAILRM